MHSSLIRLGDENVYQLGNQRVSGLPGLGQPTKPAVDLPHLRGFDLPRENSCRQILVGGPTKGQWTLFGTHCMESGIGYGLSSRRQRVLVVK